jgi:hypothetical protein
MSKPKITNEDLCRNAKKLKTGVAEVKTFLAVETKNKGFDSQGRPLVLFERHWFHKLTKGKYDKTHPNLSNRVAGGYGTSASQYGRFSKAFTLDPEAAMKSTSWGLGQVMGFNHKIAGYSTVGAFVDAMKESEGKQLDAAIAFIIANNLDGHLRNHDWKAFAKGYNGAGYRKNNYDTKLAIEYAKFSKGKQVDCTSKLALLKETEPAVEVELTETPEGEVQKTETVVNELDVTVPAEVKEAKAYNEVGFFQTIKRDLVAVTGGNFTLEGTTQMLQQFSGLPEWVVALITKLAFFVLIGSVGYLVFRVIHFLVFTWRENQRVKLEAEIASDVKKKDIRWIPFI